MTHLKHKLAVIMNYDSDLIEIPRDGPFKQYIPGPYEITVLKLSCSCGYTFQQSFTRREFDELSKGILPPARNNNSVPVRPNAALR